MIWRIDCSLLAAHLDAIVEHFERRRGAWMRRVDRRVFLTTVIEAGEVYEAARRLGLSPARVHELADDMVRYAQFLAGQPVDPDVKFPRLLPFAQRVKQTRRDRDLTAKDVGLASGMNIRNYHMVERAVRNPTLLSVMNIARVLRVTVGQLVDPRPEERQRAIEMWAELDDQRQDIYTREDGEPVKPNGS